MINIKNTYITCLVIFLTFVAALSAPVLAQNFDEQNSSLALLTAPSKDGPVAVKFDFKLEKVSAIEEESETFEFSGVLTLSWLDLRQAFDPSKAGVGEKIFRGAYQFDGTLPAWYPQLVLSNDAGTFEKRATVLRIKPDGSCTLIESLHASANTELNLRHYPFDRQTLKATFQVLGHNSSEVVLTPGTIPVHHERIVIPEWNFVRSYAVAAINASNPSAHSVSSVDINFHVSRQSLFLMRLVVLPLILIVILSWSVFWMDRSSLGDRISVSFVGILTAVAYQIVIAGIMPHISYITLMNSFLNISFMTMCATVVVNLTVGYYDKKGKTAVGNKIDFNCRWIFPLVYFGLLILVTTLALICL